MGLEPVMPTGRKPERFKRGHGRTLRLGRLTGCPSLARGDPQQYILVYPEEVPMPVARSRTFRSGNSEAIRLPKDVAFGPDVELMIVRSGDVLTVYPAGLTLTEMADRLRVLPTPSTSESRDVDELPERPGL